MNFINLVGMGTATALLAGCGVFEVQQAQRTPTSPGPAFTQALADQYKSLTSFQTDMQYDWPSAGHFAAKTLASANGQDAGPDDPAAVGVPAAWANQLADARARLAQALDFNNNRVARPQLAAKAQAAYDCWLEETHEGWQTADIGTCRGAFETAVAALTQVTQVPSPPAPAAAAPTQRTFYVYFDWDSAVLSPEGLRVIDQAADAIKANTRVVVVGHADLSGPASYNQRLSLRRSDAVKTALVQRGVPADEISTTGVGKNNPRVPTRDGARDPQNRFVEIDIQ